MQAYKTVYFPDDNGRPPVGGLTLAFGADETELYDRVAHLSSLRIRELIGVETLSQLEGQAALRGVPTSSFCRDALTLALSSKRSTTDEHFRDQLQVTFAGGKAEPLQGWYPYLEGYSPDFVREIVGRYTPTATSILDPFAGSGTTPLTAMSMGRTGLYIDVNPLCRFLIGAKAQTLELGDAERELLTKQLGKVRKGLRRELPKQALDPALKAAYRNSFGKSEFFSPTTFEDVLRARTYIDGIIHPLLKQLCSVAAIRSLIPASLLIRRGDLRFKNEKELLRQHTSFLDAFEASLDFLETDLARLTTPSGEIRSCGTNAMAPDLPGKVSAIVTSPPYLNGTNYFRNTKVELWFLRMLTSKDGLSAFRKAAITAGICDVTVGKTKQQSGRFSSERLSETLRAMNANAYDRRIPAMVETYFNDMLSVFEKLTPTLDDNGVVAIDIGDSMYAGVHVPTDALLSEMLESLGLHQVDDVTLRERASRSGEILRQSLIVFQRKSLSRASRLPIAWTEFKRELPHQHGEMAARNWGNSLHSLCSYQGKLKPSIARTLVDTFVPAGGKVLDPFAGVGTIPFEACLTGRTGLGIDISPSAHSISWAKLGRPSVARVEAIVAEIAEFITEFRMSKAQKLEAKTFGFNGKLEDYFHPQTLREVYAARTYFQERGVNSASAALVNACLQHILHGNRPYALSRRSHPITPYAPTGEFEYRPLIGRLQAKLDKSLKTDRGTNYTPGQVWLADCTAPWPSKISNLDAIITSPPFFDSTRFHSANWMRLWFAGWNSEDFKSKPAQFVDERQKRGFDVYDGIFSNAAKALKPEGLIVFHVGRSRKCDMGERVAEIAAKHFRLVDRFAESVGHCESHGIRDKGTVTAHEYLVFAR